MVTLSDSRITESSGLAMHPTIADYAYTHNDEKQSPQIFCVSVTTGRTVGTASLSPNAKEPEAVSVDTYDKLWLADIGDNYASRKDCALLKMDNFSTGSNSLSTTRYPIKYGNGPRNAETFFVNQVNKKATIISKESKGWVYEIWLPNLNTTSNTIKPLKQSSMAYMSDACWTRNGKYVLCRLKGYKTTIYVLNASYSKIGTITVPKVMQPESIDVTLDGLHIIYGSEGAGSPLITYPTPSWLLS